MKGTSGDVYHGRQMGALADFPFQEHEAALRRRLASRLLARSSRLLVWLPGNMPYACRHSVGVRELLTSSEGDGQGS